MKKIRKPIGWTFFFVECADGKFFAGFGRNLEHSLKKISDGFGYYFSTHPERLPVKLIFKEEQLSFREAYAKFLYAKKFNRPKKIKLMETKKWPYGGPLKKFLLMKVQEFTLEEPTTENDTDLLKRLPFMVPNRKMLEKMILEKRSKEMEKNQ